ADYESRLPRGRSYLRQGKVYNLEIGAGEVTAEVVGSAIYDVIIKIKPLTAPHWQEIKGKCAGQVSTLLDLLSGKLGDGVLKVITDRETGLFPAPSEIRINCNCPDSAGLCKHAAAVLYGVGLKFDADPGLFFKLRAVNPEELLSLAADVVGKEPVAGSAAVISDDDIAGLFGIDMGEIPPNLDHL
ncbi:MAG: zinc finger, domain protein, partial [Verrucomicrobiaceae bacterium]|nr:zinc finger, domain protein [Verrucomicrobiaceae bacterium]